MLLCTWMVCSIANDTRSFVQIPFQLTELFQIETDAVIYTDQFTCYSYNKKRPSKGWSGVHLVHDNASSYKCKVVKSYLASEKVKVLNHPPYSLTWVPVTSFYFQGLRKCFLEISIHLANLLAALFISVSNRCQKKTIYLLFATR